MNSRLLAVVLVVVLAGFGWILWRQQQVIDRLSSGAAVPGQAQSLVPAANIPKPTPALSAVDFTVSIAGAPIRGSEAARVVLVEFSDFQCPYCGRYVRDTLPRLNQDYVDSGKIRYAFRQFPLEGIHPNALNAAIVSSCATPRHQFWELHDQFFANQGALELPSLMSMAERAGLSDAAFKSCVETQAPLATIKGDQSEAVRVGFSGTPGFLVGTVDASGQVHAVRRLYGANPYSLFQSAIDDVLAGR
jgi:protein-disulfide isomerase